MKKDFSIVEMHTVAQTRKDKEVLKWKKRIDYEDLQDFDLRQKGHWSSRKANDKIRRQFL